VAAELTFGAWLQLRRRQLDLTQQELADRSSCSVVTIRKIEQGNRRPSKQLAGLIAAALQVPTGQVIDFIAYARQDPDSTQIPAALQGSDQAVALPAAYPESTQASRPRHADGAGTYILPRPTTPFLGREAEIETLLEYLQDPDQQLVSILGAGGMGKTRLALAVAERLAASDGHPFSDGIVFVSLAALTEPAQIASSIADGLAILVDGRRSTAEQLLAYLAPRKVLLIVDNCEHLLDSIDLLVEMAQAAPGVTVLATSRERLHLQGEQAYPIDGLSALDPLDPDSDDAMDHPVVRLFRQSAQRAAPTFALTADDLPQVARICRLVDAMPLGIELSAGWVGVMSLAEIADEVQRNLDFLASDFRDLPARHRSMRAVFDASWQHLDSVEQSIFRRLTVFRGGFTRQAAADVGGATLRHLGHLIYKSLLHYDRARNRYRLHELLHQYGMDKLAEDDSEATAVSIRHCDYFIARLVACWDLLKGEDQAGALAELDNDIDNFRLAWRAAIEKGEVVQLRPAMDTLGFYFEWRVHPHEGRAAFQQLADAADPGESEEARKTLIRALTWQASFLRQTGQPDVALDILDRADALCNHPAIDEQTRLFEQAFIANQRGYCL
jgi:predicted ATPase/DNA-binding XRE family transcriptional regulator